MARVAALLMAVALQVLPLCRVAVVSPVAAPSTWAIICQRLVGASVLLGGYHAVSGASAGISGLTKYSGSTPMGTPTNFVVEPVGQPFRYRIIVKNPGSDVAQNYFNCVPLPPGLSINTSVGAAGYITGTPTNPGTFLVTLIAGNLNYPTPVTANATLILFLSNAPPTVTLQPQDRSVLTGGDATFSVSAQGTPPLGFYWQFDGVNLPGATASVLTLTNVSSAQAGQYRAVITNAFGSVTSSVARLTVQEALVVQPRLAGPTLSNGFFHFCVTGPTPTNFVLWRATALTNWIPIRTNWVSDGSLEISEPLLPGMPASFYRASLWP